MWFASLLLFRSLSTRGCNAFLFSSFNFSLDFAIDTLHGAQVLSSLLAGLDGFERKEESKRVWPQFEQHLEDITNRKRGFSGKRRRKRVRRVCCRPRTDPSHVICLFFNTWQKWNAWRHVTRGGRSLRKSCAFNQLGPTRWLHETFACYFLCKNLFSFSPNSCTRLRRSPFTLTTKSEGAS